MGADDPVAKHSNVEELPELCDFDERIPFIGEDELGLWDMDILVSFKGCRQDDQYVANASMAKENPVERAIQLPFIFRRGSDEWCLWTRAEKAKERCRGYSELQLHEEKSKEYFGQDMKCFDWDPKCKIQYHPRLSVSAKSAPSEFGSMKPHACRFLVALGLVVDIWWTLGWTLQNPAVFLFNPMVLVKDSPIHASYVARFRHDVVWPLFGSTKCFWESLEFIFLNNLDYAFIWPEGHPIMSVLEIRDCLAHHFPEDTQIIPMTYALEAIFGSGTLFFESMMMGLKKGGWRSLHYTDGDTDDW